MSYLHYDLPSLLQASRPPDPELVDLVEQEFLNAQIDGDKADLAYEYLRTDENNRRCMLMH